MRALAAATDATGALPARAAGLCEFLLGQIARFDITLSAVGYKRPNEDFSHLLTRSGGKHACRPGVALMRWLKMRLGKQTTESLLALDSRRQIWDESTLKRWSSGREFPSEISLESFINSVARSLPEEDRGALLKDAGMQFWASRRLHKTLKIAKFCFFQGADSSYLEKQFLNNESVDQWARQRYDYWLQHWRACPTDAQKTAV